MDPAFQQILKELTVTFKAWNEDLRQTRDEYKSSIAVLDKAVTAFNTQKQSLTSKFIPWIPLITIIVSGILLIIFATVIPCGTTADLIGKFKINKQCQPQNKINASQKPATNSD